MKIYKTLETKAKHPEYHLNHSKNYNTLVSELVSIGYYAHKNDFKIICCSGYEMKEVIRLTKSKIKKDDKALEIIKKYLLTKEMYDSLEDDMYYPLIKKITSTEM